MMLQERLDSLRNKRKFVCMKYGRSHLLKFPRSLEIYVIGPHWFGVLFTVLVIVGGSYINDRMIIKLSDEVLQWRLTLFNRMMSVITTFLLLITAVSNPGIILPPCSNDLDEEKGALLASTSSTSSGGGLNGSIRRSQSGSQTGRSESDGGEQYCEYCHVYCREELQVKHCMDCGYCIERLDHHCPWMGQCIGRYNMRWFILFNISWMVYFTQFILLAVLLKV